MIVCPRCEGRKGGIAHLNYGFARPGEWVNLPCGTCGGTGEVSEDRADAIAAGQRLRDDRVARGQTLRQEAAALGISPVELSHREQGLIPGGDDKIEVEPESNAPQKRGEKKGGRDGGG